MEKSKIIVITLFKCVLKRFCLGSFGHVFVWFRIIRMVRAFILDKDVASIPVYNIQVLHWFHHICLPVRLSFNPFVQVFHVCAVTQNPFDLRTGNFTQMLSIGQEVAQLFLDKSLVGILVRNPSFNVVEKHLLTLSLLYQTYFSFQSSPARVAPS